MRLAWVDDSPTAEMKRLALNLASHFVSRFSCVLSDHFSATTEYADVFWQFLQPRMRYPDTAVTALEAAVGVANSIPLPDAAPVPTPLEIVGAAINFYNFVVGEHK